MLDSTKSVSAGWHVHGVEVTNYISTLALFTRKSDVWKESTLTLDIRVSKFSKYNGFPVNLECSEEIIQKTQGLKK